MKHSDPVRVARLREGERLLRVAVRLTDLPESNNRQQLWRVTFGPEADTVQRAANNLLYGESLSDANLTAAADMGERIIGLFPT